MLKIRLMRIGRKGQAHFRVVVQEVRSKATGKYIEDLGFWNPHQNKFEVKEERVKYWLASGAKPSDTVHNFLIDKGVIQGEKVKKGRVKKKEEPSAAKAAEVPIEVKPQEKPQEEKGA